ncbi:MAG: hypothetical protein JJE17_10975, partial [Peptostreptococcaceae bacterium]|nr:hypothetical protein [Peptostreptococcaceae bacterium]
ELRQRRFPRPQANAATRANARPTFPEGMMRSGIGNDLHNQSSNQSDANFGFTAGIAECLLQSHAGEISLLPALPVSWKNGSVTGLKARGSFEISMKWKDGALSGVDVLSRAGNKCSLYYKGKKITFDTKMGGTYHLNSMLNLKNG